MSRSCDISIVKTTSSRDNRYTNYKVFMDWVEPSNLYGLRSFFLTGVGFNDLPSTGTLFIPAYDHTNAFINNRKKLGDRLVPTDIDNVGSSNVYARLNGVESVAELIHGAGASISYSSYHRSNDADRDFFANECFKPNTGVTFLFEFEIIGNVDTSILGVHARFTNLIDFTHADDLQAYESLNWRTDKPGMPVIPQGGIFTSYTDTLPPTLNSLQLHIERTLSSRTRLTQPNIQFYNYKVWCLWKSPLDPNRGMAQLTLYGPDCDLLKGGDVSLPGYNISDAWINKSTFYYQTQPRDTAGGHLNLSDSYYEQNNGQPPGSTLPAGWSDSVVGEYLRYQWGSISAGFAHTSQLVFGVSPDVENFQNDSFKPNTGYQLLFEFETDHAVDISEAFFAHVPFTTDGRGTQQHLDPDSNYYGTANTPYNTKMRPITNETLPPPGYWTAIDGSTIDGSPICIMEGQDVLVDTRGFVKIEDIQEGDSINGNKVVSVICQKTNEKLIKFNQGCFGNNVPNKDVYVTHDHLMSIPGADSVINAGMYVGKPGVTHTHGPSKNVYSILVDGWNIMNVNNLQCETLCPFNDIAKKEYETKGIHNEFSELDVDNLPELDSDLYVDGCEIKIKNMKNTKKVELVEHISCLTTVHSN